MFTFTYYLILLNSVSWGHLVGYIIAIVNTNSPSSLFIQSSERDSHTDQ